MNQLGCEAQPTPSVNKKMPRKLLSIKNCSTSSLTYVWGRYTIWNAAEAEGMTWAKQKYYAYLS